MRFLRTPKSKYFIEDGCPLSIWRVFPHLDVLPHSHEFDELVLIVGGSGIHTTGGESYPIKAGDVFVINGRRVHGYSDTNQLNVINVLYDPALLAEPTRGLGELPGYHILFTLESSYHKRHGFANRMHLSLAELTQVCGSIDTLERELQERASGFRFMATTLFMLIIGFLSRAYVQSPSTASGELLRIAKALSHIETHYQEPVTVKELTQIAHMSERALARAFLAATGYAPIHYLVRLRLARAAEDLRRSDAKISAVSEAAGFQDSNYFSRQFRRVFGLSPSQFRQRDLR